MKRKNLVFFTCLLLIVLGALYFFCSNLFTNPKNQRQQDEKRASSPLSHSEKTTNLKASNFSPTFPISDKQEEFNESDLESQLRNLKDFCEEEFPEYKEIFPSLETLKSVLTSRDLKKMWLNLHLKGENNKVWRLRRFMDDGDNGGREQVVLYEEDETGFPRIVETTEQGEAISPDEFYQKHLSIGEAVYTDEAYSGLFDGADYFFELTNGQITRIDITSHDQHINCQVPH